MLVAAAAVAAAGVVTGLAPTVFVVDVASAWLSVVLWASAKRRDSSSCAALLESCKLCIVAAGVSGAVRVEELVMAVESAEGSASST